jgi:hypothetical protein
MSDGWIIHPLKSTEERIDRIKALQIVHGTAEQVHPSAIDDDGVYRPDRIIGGDRA